MIDTREIFDDIHESLAVQEYGQEQRKEGKLEGKLESAVAMIQLGIPMEQVASVLYLPIEAIRETMRNRR
ncbi:MAG: hypothetical protein MUF71_00065 [Candidatus Kapabacteria bacterium]|jgi:predicted transposase YdaD|nr:hypothetical protein [Candidatus Kapabacteria bacterium]